MYQIVKAQTLSKNNRNSNNNSSSSGNIRSTNGNTYNLRSRAQISDTSRVQSRPVEYISRNMVGIVVVLIVNIKMFGVVKKRKICC